MRNSLRSSHSKEPVLWLLGAIVSRFRGPATDVIDREEERRLRALTVAQRSPAGDQPDEN